MAYRNVARFYKALGRNEDETALFNALGVLAYFHLKEKMKEELKQTYGNHEDIKH